MDTTSIKNLFKLKSVPIEPKQEQFSKKEIDPTNESLEETRKRTYHESGYRDSSRTNGNHSTLSICLDAVYSKFQNEEKEMVEKQQKLKESYVNEQKIEKLRLKLYSFLRKPKKNN